MSVYTGWQHDFLSAAHLPDTTGNRRFLNDWHAHAESDCALNPIDLTSRNDHSHHCKDTGTVGRSYQRYDDPVWARTAFYAQITGGSYPHLRAALSSGNPYTVGDWSDVASDLNRWQSFAFALFYEDTMRSGPPTPTLTAPQALGGWKDLRKSINRGMPETLHHAQRVNAATLRSIARARRVRL